MSFKLLVFRSVSEVMYAERLLKKKNVPYKLVPTPKEISPDCGVSIRFDESLEGKVLDALEGKIKPQRIVELFS